MEFLAEHYPNKTIYVPTPTWGNHNAIAKRAGLKADKYRYFDPKTVGLNFAAMKEDIQNIPEGSIVLLHACAHVSSEDLIRSRCSRAPRATPMALVARINTASSFRAVTDL
jgi:hypothetical protein